MTTAHRVGDKVSVNDPKYPGIWVVEKVDKVNTVVTPENGGRPLRCPHYLLKDPTAEDAAVTPTDYYVSGELVRVTVGRYVGLYVVLVDKGDKVNIARIGGDGGRYVRHPHRGLVKVDPKDVLREES